jgi:bacteriocin biosynthesis cyclodehydratase domain-containing protein
MDSQRKFRALPVQIIEREGGIILKRGCTEFRIDGPEAIQVLQALLEVVGDGGATREQVCACFPPLYRPAVEELVQQLVVRHILVSVDEVQAVPTEPEGPLEVFYWNFGFRAEDVTARLNSRQIVIIGVNCVSRQLVAALGAAAVTNMIVVDYPLLRNVRLFDHHGRLISEKWPEASIPPMAHSEWTKTHQTASLHCLIATSDFGGMQLMREWNQFCHKANIHFFPVVLQNVVGYVGPLIVPWETACFECLRARQNSHLADPEIQRATEYRAFEGQFVNGFHPSMASVLGDIAAIELTKFYGRVPRWRVGTLVEVNLLIPSIVTRKVLRIPRCSVCSPLNKHSPASPNRAVYLPSNEYASAQ